MPRVGACSRLSYRARQQRETNLQARAASSNQRYNEQDEKHDEADLRDRRGGSGDDTEAENTGNKSNNEKYNGVA